MKYGISKSRNKNKYDKNLLPQHTIITEINAQLQCIIQSHCKNHKLNDTINQFEAIFCINEALAKIENDSLTTPFNNIKNNH